MFAVAAAAILAAQPIPKTAEPLAPPQRAAAKAQPAPLPAPAAGPRVDDDGIEIAGRDAGATRVPSAESAWGGIQPMTGPVLSQRVADYELTATLDPVKHTLEGKARLTWRNRSAQPVKHLWMHLYLNAFESPASVFNLEKRVQGSFRSEIETRKGEWGYIELRKVVQGGREAKWSFQHPDGGPETDHTVVRVDLPEAVPAGGTTTVDLDFFDQLPRVVARTGWFGTYHLVGQWYPKVGVLELPGERGATRPRWNCHEFHLRSEFYADFGTYRASITVPKGYTFASTGTLTAEPEPVDGGVRYRAAQDDVHDFAFTAWDRYAEPLTATWTGEGSPRVTVKVLFPEEYRKSAEDTLRATLDSLTYFSRTLGPYPYRQVTAVVPPYNAMESGGMEYETFFTSIGSNHDPFASAARYTAVHEFGHGYFMGLLASNEFEEPFLDEGMNELWDTRMLSDETFSLTLPGLGAFGIRTPRISYWDFERQGTQRFQADAIAGNSWERWSGASYGLVYARTVLVFHDLEAQLPEGVFARGMKEYYRRWHHRHPGTADLEKALADTAGENAPVVRRWFAEQVYDRAPVDDRVESVESAEILPEGGLVLGPDGKRVERDVDAEIKKTREAFRKAHPHPKAGEPGPFPVRTLVAVRRYAASEPQTLVVTFEDGSVERLEWPAGERWRRFTFEKPVKATAAQLDPGREVLLDLDKLDDGRTREAHPAAARRWTLEWKAWVELAWALVAAL